MARIDIDWINLSQEEASMYSAKFQGYASKFIVFDIPPEKYAYEARSALKKLGFLRLGRYHFKKADSISLSEIKTAFPSATVEERPIEDTRILIKDKIPDVLIKQGSKVATPTSDTDDVTLLNSFQATYKPKSKLGTPIAAIPLQLAVGTQKALSSIAERRGDIDEWIRGELAYPSLDEMAAVLSPEQIDAVAVAIDNAYEGSGSICADQTGLGKGRVGAALARWAANQGRMFVFLTEKANLFTDFIRDIVDTNSMEMIGEPFILNNGAKILDQATSEVMFKSLTDTKQKKVIQSGKIPEGAKMVMATYSQLNRKGSDKSTFFIEACQGAHLHSDEAHNAAGEESNTNLAVLEAMRHAESYSYSSATHAKRASNMTVYAPLLPPSITALENMIEILDAGGMPLLETLSQMLAETGRLIRREHDLSDMGIELVVDHARKDLHEANSDILAPILSQISTLSRDIGNWLEEKTNSPEAKKASEQWYSVHWGVRFSAVINQFIAASKIDLCVEQAVAALKRDEKPVIVVQNTMEAILKEIVADPEDPKILRSKITDEDGTERLPEFKDILTLLVDRTLTARVKKGKEDPETVKIEDPEFLTRAEEIKALIKGFPTLPINPMDEIARRIEKIGLELEEKGELKRGWQGGEISARSIKMSHDGVIPVQQPDRNVSINDFQHGKTDFIVLTKAASTGLSLHANPRSEDKRVRHMMEFQIPPNPVERIQFWGRIKRRGGINEPLFSCLATALSMELRTLAAQNRKIEELSANVAGSRDAGIKLDVPDPINALGNDIAKRVLSENPQIAFRMGISLNVEDEQANEELYFVNRLLSRLGLIKSTERDAIYFTFMDAYEEVLADQMAKGIHPTRPRELPGQWTIANREIFSAGDPRDGPVFGAPVYLTTLQREDYTYPIDRKTLLEIIEDRKAQIEQNGSSTEVILEHLKDKRPEILKSSLPKKYRSVMEALNAIENNRTKIESSKLASIIQILTQAKIGNDIAVSGESDEIKTGIIVGVQHPKNVEDYSKPGHYFLEYITPGDEAPRKTSLASLRNDPNFRMEKRAKTFTPDYTIFDGLPAGKVTLEKKVLDGNTFTAAQISVNRNLGSTTRITLDTGEQISAVMIPKMQQNMISSIPGMTSSIPVAMDLIKQGAELYTNPSNLNEGLVIERDGQMVKLSIPGKPKLAKPFEVPEITDICGTFKGNTRGKTTWTSPEQFEQLAEVLLTKGLRFNFSGNWRETANEIAAIEMQQEQTQELECPF